MSRWMVLSLFLLVGMALPSSAQEERTIYITGAWARPTVIVENGGQNHHGSRSPAGGVSAAYMTIENPGEQAVRLVSVTTPAAEVVEIHETTIQNDVMRMRPLDDGLLIEPGESIALEPGSFHLMLIDLTHELVAGEAIMMILLFDLPDAEPLEVVIGVPLLEEPPEAAGFVILDAWARPTVRGSEHHGDDAPAGGTSAVYMQILNRTGEDDRLVGIATIAARVSELHDVMIENDVMSMRHIHGIDLPDGEVVSLETGSLHVMLIDLEHGLVEHEAIAMVLTFESGVEMVIGVPVYEPGMMDMGT